MCHENQCCPHCDFNRSVWFGDAESGLCLRDHARKVQLPCNISKEQVQEAISFEGKLMKADKVFRGLEGGGGDDLWLSYGR